MHDQLASAQRLDADQLGDIYQLVAEHTGVGLERLGPTVDLCAELGLDGDDFSALMERYAERFTVDMAAYRWYFHHSEEGGPSLGRWLFGTPDGRVKRIAVTPALLALGAEKRQWPLSYPAHVEARVRWDILADRVLLCVIGGAAALVLLHRWFSA